MLISLSIAKYIDPEDCKWYKFKGPSSMKIESRKVEESLEKDDVIGIMVNPKNSKKFLLVYPMALNKPIDVDDRFVKKLVKKCTELSKIPKEALEGERNIRSGRKAGGKESNTDRSIATTPLDSDFFKPAAKITAAMERQGIDFTHFQWRVVQSKYDVYKPNGSNIAVTLKVGDIIGVRFKHRARGGVMVNLRGYRYVISDPDDYKAVVDATDLIAFNQWPKTYITAAQIEANKAEDQAELDKVRKAIQKEESDRREAEKELEDAKKASDLEAERERKTQEAEEKKLADEEFLRKAEIAKDKREAERKAAEGPASEEDVLKYVLDSADNEDDVVDDDDEDFSVDDLGEIDLEDDDDEPLTQPSMDNPALTADPDVRPMDIGKNTDDVTKTLSDTLSKLKEEAKEIDLDDLDGDDLDEGEELEDDLDGDLEDDSSDDSDAEDDSSEDDSEESEDDSSEDDSSEDDTEDEASATEELDEDDLEDLEDDEDSVDDLSIEEMREVLEDEGAIAKSDDLSDDEIREKFELSMEEGDEEGSDEEYDDEDGDEGEDYDEDEDESSDLDDLDGPTDDDLEDDPDAEGLEDDVAEDDPDTEGLEDDELEEADDDEYEPEEGDVVTFKTDKTNKDEHVILDIYAMPKNTNILVFKVYNIESEPEHFTLVKVSIDESKGFAKLVKFVRKMNGKEFMTYFIKAESLDKSDDPIAS